MRKPGGGRIERDILHARARRRWIAARGALLALLTLGTAGWALAADPLPACLDADGDGYAVCHAGCDATGLACGDCNDLVAAIHPGATERCNFVDDNCDGTVDEGLPVGRESFASTSYDCLDGVDNDGDGRTDLDDPECQAAVCAEVDPPGCAVADPGGCCVTGGLYQCTDTGDRSCAINGPKELHSAEGPFPAASCFDNEDNNCNGLVDQADPPCFGPEVCDGRDNNGDGEVDEGFHLGEPCTVGRGFCARTGTFVCKADQSGSECSAAPGVATAEGPVGGPSCKDGQDNDCDGLTDLADSDCQGGERCDGLDNDNDGLVDEDFPDLGSACTAGRGACEASGVKVCNPAGTGTVCSAVAKNGSPEGPAGLTCRDGIDNDCDGMVDAADPGCAAASLQATCALPYLRGQPGADCGGWHEVTFSAVNAGPHAVVTAELLALDTHGNILATLPVENGDEAHLKSRLGQISAVSKKNKNRTRHELSAPVPLLRVTVEDGGHRVQAFCSNIPYLQVFEPQGTVISASEGDVTRLVTAVPLVDPASLVLKVDGVNILQALAIDPVRCTPDAPCGGNVTIHGHSVGISELIVQSAPDVATSSANSVTMTLSGLGCGGHVHVVDGERIPGSLPMPHSAQCHEDDIRDRGTSAGFGILIDSPTAGEITDAVPTPVTGRACHGRPIASVNVNGLPVSTSGQILTRGDGENTADTYTVPIDVALAQTNLASDVAGLTTELGTFDRGSNRLVAQASDDLANRTFTTRLFALARSDELTRAGLASPVGVDIQNLTRSTVTETLSTMLASTEIPNAFALGITAEALNTFFQSTCNLATVLAEQKINEQLQNLAVSGRIPLPFCSPTVTVSVPSVHFNGSLTCNVTPDPANDKVVVHVALPPTVIHGVMSGGCKKKVLGICVAKYSINGEADVTLSGQRVDFDITETQIEVGGVSQGRLTPGRVSVNITRSDINVGCIFGVFVDVFNFVLNLFGLPDVQDLIVDKIKAALAEIDLTQRIGVQDFPLTIKQIRMNEQEVAKAKLKLAANVDHAEVAEGGLLLTLKAGFSSTSTDPEVEGAPGALLTPAPPPVPGTPPTARAGNTYFVVADDAFNQLFASLTTQGAFRTICRPSGKTIAQLAPADCQALGNPITRGGCEALKGTDCGTLPLLQRPSCALVRNKMRTFNITPSMGFLFCGRFDVPPQLLIQDDPSTDAVETVLRANDALFSVVLDRNDDDTLGGALPTLPRCTQAGSDTSADCRLLAVCLDLNLTTSLLLDTAGGNLRLVPRVEGLRVVPRPAGVACEGGISFGDVQLLQDAAASDPLQDLQSSVDTLTPALQSEGLDLGGIVLFSNPRLIAIETDGRLDFQDYVGVTGDIVPKP